MGALRYAERYDANRNRADQFHSDGVSPHRRTEGVTKKEVEAAITNHADWIEHLAGRMDELAAAMVATQAQIQATNKSLKEHGEATDKRIGELVMAIGKLIAKTELTTHVSFHACPR
jgi:hypothetical protein